MMFQHMAKVQKQGKLTINLFFFIAFALLHKCDIKNNVVFSTCCTHKAQFHAACTNTSAATFFHLNNIIKSCLFHQKGIAENCSMHLLKACKTTVHIILYKKQKKHT